MVAAGGYEECGLEKSYSTFDNPKSRKSADGRRTPNMTNASNPKNLKSQRLKGSSKSKGPSSAGHKIKNISSLSKK